MENIKKEYEKKQIKNKNSRVLNVQEFCRALVLSRQIDDNIKNFNVQRSKEELNYDGGIYEDYKNLQLVINKDRNYKSSPKGHSYDYLTEEDIALIKSTIEQFQTLNKVMVHSSVPFSLDAFLQATLEMLKEDKPILYYNLATSGEIGYFRSYSSDYKIIYDIIRGQNWSKTRSNKSIKESLSEQDLQKLKELYESGFFVNRVSKANKKVNSVRKQEYRSRSFTTGLNIPKFTEAYKLFLTLNKSIETYDTEQSKELLNYDRCFRVDWQRISSLLRGLENNYSYKLTDEDRQILKECGFVDHLIKEFDVELFINIVEYLQEIYGDELFIRPQQCLRDFGEEQLKELGYTRKFERDYILVRDIMCAKEKTMKLSKIPGLYESLDKNAEICLLNVANGGNSKITKPFNVEKFVEYYYIYKNPNRRISRVKFDTEYGRDIDADIVLVERALNGYKCPEYILQEVNSSKRILLMNIFGKGNVVSRLSEFFKAWEYFLEIPSNERDYRDFYDDISEEILEYPYNFNHDYSYIANLYFALKEDINNKQALSVLQANGITAQAFLDYADSHNFMLEKQFKRKKKNSTQLSKKYEGVNL